MEEIRKQFIEASALFIANWYNITTKNHVLKDSQNTLRLGRGKLASMKIKLKTLIDDSKKTANEFLDDRSLWWHFVPKIENNNTSPYLQCGHKCPEIIDIPIRKALGKLGIILKEYGYNINTREEILEMTFQCGITRMSVRIQLTLCLITRIVAIGLKK